MTLALNFLTQYEEDGNELFRQLKKELGGQHFPTQELILAVRSICTTLVKIFIAKGQRSQSLSTISAQTDLVKIFYTLTYVIELFGKFWRCFSIKKKQASLLLECLSYLIFCRDIPLNYFEDVPWFLRNFYKIFIKIGIQVILKFSL